MPTEGLELANEAVGLLERSGTRIFLSRVYGVIVEIDLIGGRYAEGLVETEKGTSRLLRDRRIVLCQPRSSNARDAEQAINSHDGSFELTLRQSLDLAIIQDTKALELRAAIRLADLWICQGKRDQARNLLRPICDWFTEGHDTPDFQQAAEMLNRLE